MISRPTALASAMSLPTSSPSQHVGPFGGARPARVDREQARARCARLEDVVEEDRMRLAGIAAPEDDQVGLLDLTV